MLPGRARLSTVSRARPGIAVQLHTASSAAYVSPQVFTNTTPGLHNISDVMD
jgi:hypothetical protein